LDIGANLGYYSVLLSKYIDNLVCVEPNRQAIKVLEENINENTNNTPFEIAPIALGVDSTEKLYMQENKQINLSKVSYESGDYEIEHATLTELLKKYKPGIIKMDIE
jgi:FkbM family methyltransferase